MFHFKFDKMFGVNEYLQKISTKIFVSITKLNLIDFFLT